MSKNIFVFDNNYIEDLKKQSPVFTENTTFILYSKLEKDKRGKIIEDTTRKDESLVKFILIVSTRGTDKMVIDDLTGFPYFKATPQKYIASTLWENCCIVAKEFIDAYKNPAIPDYKFYPNTDLIKSGAFIHNETNEVYVFCQLILDDSLEEHVNCVFVENEKYQEPFDIKLYNIFNQSFRKVRCNDGK